VKLFGSIYQIKGGWYLRSNRIFCIVNLSSEILGDLMCDK